MPSTFRPYSKEELARAAQSYGLDPAFVEAVYAVESSRGTDPNAMTVRSVKRKRDRTLVRGPFQLEDDTVNDLIRKQKLGPVNVDDPDTHLDLAMRLMADLRDRYDGDYRKMAQAYLGGPGGVTNPNAKDELGTSTASYGNKILAEMQRISGGVGGDTSMPPMVGLDLPGDYAPPTDYAVKPYVAADAGDTGDMFGLSSDMLAMPSVRPGSWLDLAAANRGGGPVGLGIPMELGGTLPELDVSEATADDTDSYIARLVHEEMDGRDFRA